MKKINSLMVLSLIFVGLTTFSQDWTTCDDFTDTTNFPFNTYVPGELIGYSQGGTQEINIGLSGVCNVNFMYPGIFGTGYVDFEFDGSNKIAQYKIYTFADIFADSWLSVNGSAYHTLAEAYPMTLAGVIVNVVPEVGPDAIFDYFVVTYEGVIDSISFFLLEAGIMELCVAPLEETDLSLVEETTNQLTAFPNPVEDMLTITSNEQLASVKIYTITGDLVLAQPVISDEIIQLSFAELQAGFYFVVGTSLNGDEFISKIAKN